MRKVLISAFLVALAVPGYSAYAGDDSLTYDSGTPTTGDSRYDSSWDTSSGEIDQQAGVAGEDAGQSTADVGDMKKGGLMDEVVGIKPQVGAINYRDTTGRVNNRGILGLGLEMNAASTIANITGMDGLKSLYVGPSTGFFYSHTGASGSNFYGTNSSLSAGGEGSNLFFIPANLKIGTNAGPFRLAVHGGGNLFYRSVANSVALGVNPDTDAGSAWSFLPNVGADIELGVTNAIAFVLRPDLTFGGSNRVWTASLGASIPLG